MPNKLVPEVEREFDRLVKTSIPMLGNWGDGDIKDFMAVDAADKIKTFIADTLANKQWYYETYIKDLVEEHKKELAKQKHHYETSIDNFSHEESRKMHDAYRDGYDFCIDEQVHANKLIVREALAKQREDMVRAIDEEIKKDKDELFYDVGYKDGLVKAKQIIERSGK